MTLLEELKSILSKDERLTSNNKLLKNRIVELSLKLDKGLITLLLRNEKIKGHFFKTIDTAIVFDQEKFMKFVNNKEFLPDSYTAFKNKIGLTADKRYVAKNREVVLAWPYKDCVLEGGQEKTNEKRKEIFHNKVLAPDEIDKLLEPKVLTNFKRIDENGEHKVTEIRPTDNFFIRGNNLLVLHSLKKTFRGKIKAVYIDPPYNIGNDEFQYNDNFNHSTWLTFMKNRLEVAKELMRKDGAIFVQIDHHELGYLIVLMDEIFGIDNKVQIISVKTASPAGFKTVNPGPVDVTEYILFYTRSKKDFKFKRNYVVVGYHENYNKVIVNFEEDPKKWKLESIKKIVLEENGIKVDKSLTNAYKEAEKKWGKYWKIVFQQIIAKYALENKDRVVSIRDPHKPVAKLKELLLKSKKQRDQVVIYEGSNGDRESESYIINGGALAFYSNKVREIDEVSTPTELLTDFWNDISWAGIAREGNVRLKNGKKPERLLRRIIEMSTEPGDIVLDYHLGSGTTCAVAHKMGRKYIGIEQLDYGNNDPNIRLRNVVAGDQTGISKTINWQSGGSFVYCSLKELNEVFVQRIIKSNKKEELARIWQEMKKNGFLSYRINEKLFDENIDEFQKLELKEQKRVLIECLEVNHLYVSFSEIKDSQYKVSKEDIELNKTFYRGL